MKAQIMECTMSDQNSNMRWSLDWYYFRVPETLVKPFISWCKNVQNVAHRQPMGLPRNPHLNHLFSIIFSYFLIFSGVFWCFRYQHISKAFYTARWFCSSGARIQRPSKIWWTCGSGLFFRDSAVLRSPFLWGLTHWHEHFRRSCWWL